MGVAQDLIALAQGGTPSFDDRQGPNTPLSRVVSAHEVRLGMTRDYERFEHGREEHVHGHQIHKSAYDMGWAELRQHLAGPGHGYSEAAINQAGGVMSPGGITGLHQSDHVLGGRANSHHTHAAHEDESAPHFPGGMSLREDRYRDRAEE